MRILRYVGTYCIQLMHGHEWESTHMVVMVVSCTEICRGRTSLMICSMHHDPGRAELPLYPYKPQAFVAIQLNAPRHGDC